MKKLINYSVGLLALAVVLSGCYYDTVNVFVGLPENIGFQNDVMPIFNANCSMTGCHDAAGAHHPRLDYENAYADLISGKYINTAEPEKSRVYQEIAGNTMPPTASLTVNEKKIILAWITEGALNN
jgi:hypothetical protein